jgi:hypothetical protein
MSKHHNKRQLSTAAQAPITTALPQVPNTPSVWAWLVSTLLFASVTGTVASDFWSASFIKNSTIEHDTLHFILGIAGVLAFLIEPVILKIYEQPEKGKNTANVENHGFLRTLANGIFLVLLIAPMSILSVLRPVLRAMLLIISFGYLKIGGPESAPCVIVVLLDIVLYYCGMFSEKLSLPAFVVSVFNIKAHPRLLNIGTLFFIFYNALIYFFIASVGYYKESSHQTPGVQAYLLICFWIVATMYTRAIYLPDDTSDLVGYFKKMPKRYVIFQAVILSISFVTYMWPYFRGGWR